MYACLFTVASPRRRAQSSYHAQTRFCRNAARKHGHFVSVLPGEVPQVHFTHSSRANDTVGSIYGANGSLYV